MSARLERSGAQGLGSAGASERRPPPPSYVQRYPEGRERLLALAERRESGLEKSPSASAMPLGQPKMGLRGRPDTRPKTAHRPAPLYASEASLPDKLSQALRGLATPFRSGPASRPPPSPRPTASSASVAADDVLFYPSPNGPGSALHHRAHSPAHASSDSLPGPARDLEDVMHQLRSANTHLSALHQPPPLPSKFAHGVNSLDQLRQLYKSMPDCSSLGRNGEVAGEAGEEKRDDGRRSGHTTRLLVNQEEMPTREASPYSNVDAYREQLQQSADRLLAPQRPRAKGPAPQPPPLPAQPPPAAPPSQPSQSSQPPPLRSPGGDSPTDSGYRSVPRHLTPSEASQLPSPSQPPFAHSTPLKDPVSLDCGLSMEHLNSSGTLQSAPLRLASEGEGLGDSLCDRLSTLSTSDDSRPDAQAKPKTHTRSQLLLNAGLSFETINTNVSIPEEFSLERCPKLAEPERLPWEEADVVAVLQRGRTKDLVETIAVEVVPRLSFLLRRPLVRLARELSRLASRQGKATKRDAQYASRLILTGGLAESCDKAGLTATALYAMSGSSTRQSKSARAGLRLSVGAFHRWLLDAAVSPAVLDQAAVFVTAVLECFLEELVMATAPSEGMLSLEVLERALGECGEFWGLLQPCQHLINARTAAGLLCLPNSSASSHNLSASGPLWNGSHHSTGQDGLDASARLNLEQCLLATCVGSVDELADLIGRVCDETGCGNQSATGSSVSVSVSVASHGSQNNGAKAWPRWRRDAIQTLFYFMKCSQLSHAETEAKERKLQLTQERPYLILPPLLEYLRVSVAHCQHREGGSVAREDVLQAARLLLPNLDCPPADLCPDWQGDAADAAPAQLSSRLRQRLAFQLLETGRAEMVNEAAELLGPKRLNTATSEGLTPLMMAALSGERSRVRVLLERGADLGLGIGERGPLGESEGWTALTLAIGQGDVGMVQALLEAGADVEAEAMRSETPLQMAAMRGETELVSLLLRCGADPYRSTQPSQTGSRSGPSHRAKGSPAPIALAASHGHRSALHLMVRKGQRGREDESLSLADFLSPGQEPKVQPHHSALGKAEMRVLQEAMYHAAESGHWELALDMRNLGVSWTLAVWTRTLAASARGRRKTLTQRLFADLLASDKLWDEVGQDFVEEGLPLLLDVFGSTRSDSVLGQCAEILCRLYGEEPIPKPSAGSGPKEKFAARIDAHYVNNAELSDVRFLVQGRVFYAHKIVLVNAGRRLKDLVSSAGSEPIPLEDVRYEVLELVMGYLYRGSLEAGAVGAGLLVEVVGAAAALEVEGLGRAAAAALVDGVSLHNAVEIYRFARGIGPAAEPLLAFLHGFFLQNLSDLVGQGQGQREREAAEGFRKLLRSRRHSLVAALLPSLAHRLRIRLGLRH